MGLKIFITSIFFIAIFFYFSPIQDTKKDIKNEDIPLFIFEKPVMYSFDESGLNRIIIAKQAIRYENRDEMYFGDITLNNSNEKKEFNKENIKSDFIVKRGGIYTLKENVEYKRDDFIKINTDHLIYDDLNKIAKNSKPFKAEYYTHRYNGENLYFEIEKNIINSKNTHFEIDMNNKEVKR
ncbi:LPS export ABC transporter periplasmic protein LptC [Aliarcobacter vitoriensis]|uniref:LPS export ABC transporter periplasmic protein LptC n=1 Tax=Aliarcobacter vitoriensis TaxID=2011099 RepID=UPI003AAFE729